MKTFSLVVLVLSCWAVPAAAQQLNGQDVTGSLTEGAPWSRDGHESSLDAEKLETFRTLLSGYEYYPSQADLLAVDADPVPYLLALTYAEDELTIHRHRALGALAYFPGDNTRAHLLYLLQSEATPEMTRHHVMGALARGFGDTALSALEPYLGSDDLQLRLTAVSSIASISSEESAAVLTRALPNQERELVRERIQEALTTGSSTQLQ